MVEESAPTLSAEGAMIAVDGGFSGKYVKAIYRIKFVNWC